MKERRNATLTILIFALSLFSHIAIVAARSYAQEHEPVYNMLTVLDAMDSISGSGYLDLNNQFTWTYAMACSKESRPWWHRLLFWNFYEVSHDYAFRPEFPHDFPPAFEHDP